MLLMVMEILHKELDGGARHRVCKRAFPQKAFCNPPPKKKTSISAHVRHLLILSYSKFDMASHTNYKVLNASEKIL